MAELTKLEPDEEQKFQVDYSNYAKNTGMNENPDDSKHYYDYRGLWKDTGSLPGKGEHGDSKFKLEGHPRTYVNEKNKGSVVPKKGYKKTNAKGGFIRGNGCEVKGKTKGRFV